MKAVTRSEHKWKELIIRYSIR